MDGAGDCCGPADGAAPVRFSPAFTAENSAAGAAEARGGGIDGSPEEQVGASVGTAVADDAGAKNAVRSISTTALATPAKAKLESAGAITIPTATFMTSPELSLNAIFSCPVMPSPEGSSKGNSFTVCPSVTATAPLMPDPLVTRSRAKGIVSNILSRLTPWVPTTGLTSANGDLRCAMI